MPIRIVQSKQNARLKELRKALAHPGRNERGLVGIEGPNLVAEAMRSGLRVDSVFAGSERMADEVASQDGMADVDVLVVPDDSLRSILMTESPQCVAALVEAPEWTWEDVLKGQEEKALIVVLAGAAAVEIGTASFWDPCATERVVDALESWCLETRIQKITDLIGGLQTG